MKFFDEIKTFFELHIVSKSLVAYKLIFWYSTMELDEHILRLQSSLKVVFKLSNGHSPQIRQNGELLVQMCRGE